MTSVSVSVAKWCPWPSSSARSSRKLYISPLKTTQMVPVSLLSGWCPPARSMMDSRRNAKPASAGGFNADTLVVRAAVNQLPRHRHQSVWLYAGVRRQG